MGVLEQITQMKNQGIPNQEIVNQLQQQGVSPKEINDALNQAQIKSAVSDTGTTQEIQSSAMSQSPPLHEQSPPAPQTQEIYAPQPQQESYSSQEYYPQQEYYQGGGYDDYAPEGTNADTMIEIAEQVFSEKIKKIQKQVAEINEFKTLAQTKIDHTAERLKKIETTIDKLQIAVLDKVGSYGKNLEIIKKEMSMMQDSFGKMVKHTTTKHTPIRHTTAHKKTISKKKK